MKKACVTGSTKGVGRVFTEYLFKNGYEVLGISRNPPVDDFFGSHSVCNIRDTEDCIQKILKYDPEVFVNNAHSDFVQIDLLTALAKHWKMPKVIVNVSSNASDFAAREAHIFGLATYDTEKLALDYQVKKIQFSCPNLKIINMRPGLIDTSRVEGFKGAKMTIDNLESTVHALFQLLNDGVYVQEITFSHPEQFNLK